MKKTYKITVDVPNELVNNEYLKRNIKIILNQIPKQIDWCYTRYKQEQIDKENFEKCSHMWQTSYERTSAYDSEYITKCTKCGAYK